MVCPWSPLHAGVGGWGAVFLPEAGCWGYKGFRGHGPRCPRMKPLGFSAGTAAPLSQCCLVNTIGGPGDRPGPAWERAGRLCFTGPRGHHVRPLSHLPSLRNTSCIFEFLLSETLYLALQSMLLWAECVAETKNQAEGGAFTRRLSAAVGDTLSLRFRSSFPGMAFISSRDRGGGQCPLWASQLTGTRGAAAPERWFALSWILARGGDAWRMLDSACFPGVSSAIRSRGLSSTGPLHPPLCLGAAKRSGRALGRPLG